MRRNRIRRCLDALFTGIEPGELDVVVVYNGCSTRPRPWRGHPAIRSMWSSWSRRRSPQRFGSGMRRRRRSLASTWMPMWCCPGRQPVGCWSDCRRVRSLPGRRSGRSQGLVGPGAQLFRARSQVPAVMASLWGAGVYGLSEADRRRFGAFPDLVADDLWVDGHFDAAEVEIVDCPPVVVVAPQRSRDLVRILRRVYFGKSETASAPDPDGRAPETVASTMRDLGRLVAAGPAASLDAATYAAFAAGGRLAVSLGSLSGDQWRQDDSSRTG